MTVEPRLAAATVIPGLQAARPCAKRGPRTLTSRLRPPRPWSPRMLILGATGATDAPFRETEDAITAARARGTPAVEMEAAGLHAFAQVRNRAVVCLANATNQMGTIEGEFEKREDNGTPDALAVVSRVVKCLR